MGEATKLFRAILVLLGSLAQLALFVYSLSFIQSLQEMLAAPCLRVWVKSLPACSA